MKGNFHVRFGERGGETRRPLGRKVRPAPTLRSGRLLAPFKDVGHSVLGVELDSRVATSARRALGSEAVRVGDVLLYAGLLNNAGVDTVAINPPYALWWPKDTQPGWEWELAGYENIESQHAALEIATHALRDGGLLLALYSGDFWEHHPQALTYLKRHYQLILRARVPQPFKAEYGIDVDGSIVVALRRDTSEYVPKWEEAPEGVVCSGKEELVQAARNAWQALCRAEYRSAYGTPLKYVYTTHVWPVGRLPQLPHLEMIAAVDTRPAVRLTGRGLRAENDWSAAWLALYGATVPAYNDAEWTVTDVADAYGSLPNLLSAGTERTQSRWQSLGFQVEVSRADAERIKCAAGRYAREATPLVAPSPMEYLGHYQEGRYTAVQDVTVTPHGADQPVTLRRGASYHLKPGWVRSTSLAKTDVKPDGVTLRTYLDTGFMRFQVRPEDGEPFSLTENRQEEVKALIDAFGLPEVTTARQLPDFEKWERSLARLMDGLAERNGGLRLYDFQAGDVAQAATKPFLALLYEQGGGKTVTFAHWAALRGYRRVLVVCQSGLVPNWQKELGKFGFTVVSLFHGEISRLKAQLKAEREAHRQADPEVVAAYHRQRRHLKNLLAIQAKGKARDPQGIAREIEATQTELEALRSQLPYDPEPGTVFYVVSYEALSLSDPVYDAWECEHYNRKGEWVETVKNTGHTCQGCGTPYTRTVTACPKCGAQKGPDGWQGTNCRACGYVAFTYGHGQGSEGHRQIAYARRIRRLFGAVGVDEAQLAKNVQALRGQAVHSLKARGRALLTGTLMRGYVTDLFWNIGWLLGQGGPLWPFAHKGGSRRFLAQFGTFEYVTKEFEDTLSSGKRKQIPSVSNLVRLWRLLAPAAIRRLKTDVLAELPAKHRHVEWVEPGPIHAGIVSQVEAIVEDAIANELRLHPDDPCMGVISRALWWARYAASCPDENGLPYYSEAFGIDLRPELPQGDEEAASLLATYREAAQHMGVNTDWLNTLRQPDVRQEIGKLVEMMAQRLLLDGKALPLASGFPKAQRAVEIVRAAHRSGEKTIIFTSLRALLASTVYHLKQAGLNPTVITAETPARKRLEVIQRFQSGNSPVLVAGLNVLNRGFTITAANHVVILNLEWSPEDTTQAEDRVHRPGQTKEVHVHYLLTPGSAEEDMYQLISDKDAAQRSVTDKLARDRDVADLLKQAASAQLKVAQRLVTRRAEKPAELVHPVAPATVFGRREKLQPQPKQVRPILVGAIQLSFFDVAA